MIILFRAIGHDSRLVSSSLPRVTSHLWSQCVADASTGRVGRFLRVADLAFV